MGVAGGLNIRVRLVHMSERPIVIVGAGITGCVIAGELTKKGINTRLIEKEIQVGGLARSFRYKDFFFDIGPHRFSSNKNNIMEFIQGVLKGDARLISRKSKVFFLNKYHSWPLNPWVLLNLPAGTLMKSAFELLLMTLRKRRDIQNFREYILEHYGPTLYNIFFKDYTVKFLGLEPESIHSDWAKESVKRTIIDERMGSRNLLDILKLIFYFRPLRMDFLYPHSGIDLFCRRLEEQIKGPSGKIQLSAPVKGMSITSGRITEVLVNGEVIKPDKVIWTASLTQLCRLLNIPDQSLSYLSLILYYVEINRPPDLDFQWCYYGSPEITFNRATIPSRFDETMAPQGKGSVCVEVTCLEGDAYWNNPQSLTERIKKDLIKTGLIRSLSDIENIHIQKIPDAYPIYIRDYQQRLGRIKRDLSGIKNKAPIVSASNLQENLSN